MQRKTQLQPNDVGDFRRAVSMPEGINKKGLLHSFEAAPHEEIFWGLGNFNAAA